MKSRRQGRNLLLWGAVMVCGIFGAANGLEAYDRDNVAVIEYVEDANTLVLSGGIRIRLIGVRAPSETDTGANEQLVSEKGVDDAVIEEYAREARGFVKYLVEGKEVYLETDPAFVAKAHRDKERRIFAYVWFTSPIFSEPPPWLVADPEKRGRFDAFLNASIIRRGFAAVDTQRKFTRSGKFLALEDEAQKHYRGIWGGLAVEEESGAEHADVGGAVG